MKTKLEKLIEKINPNHERKLYLSIGGYWAIINYNNNVFCVFDNGEEMLLNDNCKLENTTTIKAKDIKYLYSIINGYLKNKIETIKS